MHISFSDFNRERLSFVFSGRFPQIVLILGTFAGVGLILQSYVHWFVDGPPLEGEVISIDMRIVQGQWKWEPDIITAPSGSVVEVRIHNEDAVTHGFAIIELGIDERLPGGRTTTFTFAANIEPGEYPFYCSIFCGVGHFGQRGMLVVTESGAPIIPTDLATVDLSHIPVRSLDDAIAELPYVFTDDGEVKEFQLSVDEVMWDYGDGTPIYSWGYNAQLPGPAFRVTEGDRIRVVVTNNLPEATTVHWHGVDLEWEADGVPGVTMDPIKPGEVYVYEFTAKPAGTRIYHTHGSHHGDEAKQMDMGLAGAFIIEPVGYEAPDKEVTWVLTERIQYGIYPIGGAIFPKVPTINVREGDLVRVRMINAGSSTFHPMHLHGHQFKIVAIDGNPVPEVAQLTRNTQPILPGETYDIEFIANNPGHWLFHCHELQHAAGGMIADILYEGFVPTYQPSVPHQAGQDQQHVSNQQESPSNSTGHSRGTHHH